MKLETFFFTKKTAWSVPTLPELNSDRTLVLLFSAPEYIDRCDAIGALKQAYPDSKILGCSSAGEILQDSVADGSIVVAVLQFEHTNLKTVSAPIQASPDSFSAGQQLAEQLSAEDLSGIFLLSPGTHVNGSELIKGIYSRIAPCIPVTGGLAGDGGRFEQTWTVMDGNICPDRVVATGLYGKRVRIGFGSGGGWDIFGPERRVTAASGNVLYTLDDKPALGLYKRYLGDRAEGLPATGLLFPLAVSSSQSNGREVVRTILSVDEADQSMTFAGDIPTGSMARLMKANIDRLIDGAVLAAEQARNIAQNGDPMLCIAISCVGRRFVMSGRTDEELESTLGCLPSHAKQIGFYSYGEIAPVDGAPADLHNQTMTLTTISEA